MTPQDIRMICTILVLAVILFFLAGYAQKNKHSMFRLPYLLPSFLVLIYLCITDFEISLLPAYLGALVVAVGFLKERVRVRRCACIAGAVLGIISVPFCMANPGYRMVNFTQEFEETFAVLKENYCLTQHKGIDWESLYEKYLPRFEAVQSRHDEVENYLTWLEFTKEFYDGHVYYNLEDEKLLEEAKKKALGNDYGLALVLLSDGRIAAANVEKGSEAEKAGLYNGAIVTSWDGKDPKEMAKTYQYPFFNMPDAENEEFYNMLTVAGMGGEQVQVGFLDKYGQEDVAVLHRVGYFAKRYEETLTMLDQGANMGTLTFTQLNEDTVLYRVKEMGYDSKSYMSGDHTKFENELKEALLSYRNAGMKNLVIDLRCNGGGSPRMILAMAGLLGSEGEHFYMREALIDEGSATYVKEENTGNYVAADAICYTGQNLWKNGRILILVNGQCISAGDHFIQLMGEMENVTIAGITKSNASGQGIGVIDTHNGSLSYSAVPALDEEGNPFIDTGIDHISRVPFDVKIPLDSDVVSVIFDEGKDYVLEYALTNLFL